METILTYDGVPFIFVVEDTFLVYFVEYTRTGIRYVGVDTTREVIKKAFYEGSIPIREVFDSGPMYVVESVGDNLNAFPVSSMPEGSLPEDALPDRDVYFKGPRPAMVS